MAAWARRSPRARLYSLVPRSSTCPSTSTSRFGLAFSQRACAWRISAASGGRVYLPKWRWMSCTSGTAANSFGAGGEGGGGAGATGAGATGAGAGAWAAGGGAGAGCTAPVGAGAETCATAGRLAHPPRTIRTIRRGRTASRPHRVVMKSILLSLENLFLTHRHRLSPPSLFAGQPDVPARDARRGAFTVARREVEVIARGEVGRMRLPRRPFLARGAAGDHERGGADHRQGEQAGSHTEWPPARVARCDVLLILDTAASAFLRSGGARDARPPSRSTADGGPRGGARGGRSGGARGRRGGAPAGARRGVGPA